MAHERPARVWAPHASAVTLHLGDRRAPMLPADGGWYEATGPLVHGQDYAFALDGGEPLPDPRSPWQPHGVHGASRHVDHGRFAWTDRSWRGVELSSSVLYELHVGTFTAAGTFDGAIERLDHLVTLGVDVVEVLPVAEFPGVRGWGYDGVDLYAPHHAYGGPDGLKRLVDVCHARGLGVLLDVVYNHLGPSGNHLARFGPYFTDRYHTPWGEALNTDGPGSPEVRAFVLDNAAHWLRHYHLDGLRLDAVHEIVDTSATHLLEELADSVATLRRELGRPLHLVAESDRNDPRLVAPTQAGGTGLDAVWADDVHHAVHTLLTDERDGYYADYGTVADLAAALTTGYAYDGRRSPHLDLRRGRTPGPRRGRHLVAALQNHDQIGNRATGDRIAHRAGCAAQRVGAALVLLSPFVPMLFQGEEWAASAPFAYVTDHDDPVLARAVSQGRRAEFAAFGWQPDDVPDPQDPATFERSVLDWSELSHGDHAEMLEWYRALIALRRHPALADDRLPAGRVLLADEARRTLAVARGPLTIAANLGTAPTRYRPPTGAGGLMLGSGARWIDGELALDGHSVAVLGPPER